MVNSIHEFNIEYSNNKALESKNMILKYCIDIININN